MKLMSLGLCGSVLSPCSTREDRSGVVMSEAQVTVPEPTHCQMHFEALGYLLHVLA